MVCEKPQAIPIRISPQTQSAVRRSGVEYHGVGTRRRHGGVPRAGNGAQRSEFMELFLTIRSDGSMIPKYRACQPGASGRRAQGCDRARHGPNSGVLRIFVQHLQAQQENSRDFSESSPSPSLPYPRSSLLAPPKRPILGRATPGGDETWPRTLRNLHK